MEDESSGRDTSDYPPRTNALITLKNLVYLHTFPSYGNKIFYGLGFLALTCLAMLGVTGITMAFMGQSWWLHAPAGIYFRSVHLWTVQAFFVILILHIIVGFSTSGFKKPRRMVWVFGATIFCLAMIQTEFGYGLRGDFSSQYRAVSGADFWNGAYLGWYLNPLNYTQTFALHVIIIPITIFLLFLAHYMLVHTYGIAKPWRKKVKYRMVTADHSIMYTRGAVLVALILILAAFFHSPYVPRVRISHVAQSQPALVAHTLYQEFTHTSDTATYLDSIDPYTFNTREVFVAIPYDHLVGTTGATYSAWDQFVRSSSSTQATYIAQAAKYFPQPSDSETPSSIAVTSAASEEATHASSTAATASTTALATAATNNPVVAIIRTIMPATKNGTYTAIIDSEDPASNYTYRLRFLRDMGVLHDKAASLHMDTSQWGMAKDETGSLTKLPFGSWWLAPLGFLNTELNLLENPNGDAIGAEILFLVMLLFITYPYLSFVNRIPELLPFDRFIWRDKKAEQQDS